jgi:hypothetical protein
VVVVGVLLLAGGVVVAILLYRRKARMKREKAEVLHNMNSEMDVIGSLLPSAKNPLKRAGLLR